jgi:hypothetical protein
MMKTKIATLVMAAGAFFGITAHEHTAEASLGTLCTVTVVWFDQGPNSSGQSIAGQLKVFCAEDTTGPFFAFTNEPLCSTVNRNLDTLKIWSSMATGFQLAGRKIFIDYNPSNPAPGACGVKTINHIRTG